MKYYRSIHWLTEFSTLTLACGCAGPHTPLGAVWTLTPTPAAAENIQETPDPLKAGPEIRITPSKQILHGPTPVRITIKDPIGDLTHYSLRVRYNGYDVSDSFARQSRFRQEWQDRTLVIENPVVRLPASSDHVIEFSYRNATGSSAYARFDSPLCHAFKPRTVSNTGDFRPSRALIQLIEKTALKEGFNPAFFTGLVAQESRFEPNAVSWAKAVGLTQITSTAAREVTESRPDWPRYPGIEEMPVDRLKVLIMSGRVNARNEWRLDTRHSIEGGVVFVRILVERWSTEGNLEKIRAIFPDQEQAEVAMTQLVLASYHSGYARVRGELDRLGKDWLRSSELKEARKYVNRIFSYCHHFVENEV